MIIKIEFLIDTNEEELKELYEGDERNIPQIILDELQTTLEYGDLCSKIIIGQAFLPTDK